MNNLLLLYFFIINLIGYFLMYLDKQKAKKDKWRIKESTLFIVSIIGGSIGTFLGMKVFRHKTKHLKFKVGIPFIIIVQALFIYFLNTP